MPDPVTLAPAPAARPTSLIVRLVSYVGSNASVSALIYFGATGTEWAARVAAFLVWFSAIGHAVMAALVNDPDKGGEVRKRLMRTRPLSLKAFDGVMDFAYVVTFVALGWWWTMIGAICMTLAGESARSVFKKAAPAEASRG